MAIQSEWWCSENPVFLSSDNAAAFAAGLDAFSPPPPPQQQVHFVNQNFGNVMMAPMHPQQVMPDFPLNLAAQFEKQKLDLDRFICLQNERLRFGVQEQRMEQLGLILRSYEAKTQFLLKYKEGEMRVAMNKRAELESLVKRLESEKQSWEQVVKEKEAMVASLSKTLEGVRESTWAEDAESCNDEDDQVLFFLDQGNHEGEQGLRKMVCKSCNVRCSSVVFLPCKHLSSCKSCEAFLHSCPICRLPKTSFIPALLS
ncbi:probable BOI-related E3 ubiquitin-protein ligase 3 [Ipomoea triloba]|uniref:probable BOI-related E3 ubiquitin-protein ligase 3 n=1 Tax=Ipomoea triloba TaxID=35885 RepID=UPI00125E734C|nr:probable BOI-related E3 ubiquitin-protein ligase 3 [Ipomoea triloba]